MRRSVADWLSSMGLIAVSALDRYIGYWQPYATSHRELDADTAVQEEVRNTAHTLLNGVRALRTGQLIDPAASLQAPRQN